MASALTELNAAGSRVVPDYAPVDFVPKKWTSVVLKDGEVNKHGWEFALLHEARTALRAGDLTVSGSQRYAAWDSDLYQSDVWASRRDAWDSEQGLPRDGESFVSDSLDQLHRQTQRVAKRMTRNKNPDACVEGEKLKLTALEKVESAPGGEYHPIRFSESVSLDRVARTVDGGQSLDTLCGGIDASHRTSSALR